MEVSSEQSRLKILKSQIAVLHTDFIFDAKDLAVAHAESPPNWTISKESPTSTSADEQVRAVSGDTFVYS
jgi:hypothetical protein